MKTWDIILGAIGFVATLSLERFFAIGAGFLTCVLLCLRIYVTWKHRHDPPPK